MVRMLRGDLDGNGPLTDPHRIVDGVIAMDMVSTYYDELLIDTAGLSTMLATLFQLCNTFDDNDRQNLLAFKGVSVLTLKHWIPKIQEEFG
jgi:hypothetical protein